MGDYENLVDMGFDPRRAKLALAKTKGFNDAITWLADNEDTPIEELEAQAGGSKGDEPSGSGSGEGASATDIDPNSEEGEGDGTVVAGANSLKCGICGKLFRTPAQAQFHASKSGHDEFEESTEVIKPLTEEEKAAKLVELKAKLAEKRAAQAVIDAKEARSNEAIRRKKDAESERLKEELRKKEQMKEAEKRRREKADDAKAKEKIRAQIKADQDARRAKAEAEKAAREGRTLPQSETTAAEAPKAPRTAASYTESRLQLRLPGGQPPLVKTFPVDTTLFEIAAAVEEERGWRPSSFSTTFPRKTYDQSEFGLTLAEAKMVPSAALVLN